MSRVTELQALVDKLEKENTDLKASIWVLENDIQKLGPENRQLFFNLNAAKVEIARLNALLQPKARGRQRKDYAGTYEGYLVRETMQIVVESMQNGGKRMTERDAALMADKNIRAAAKQLQENGMGGALHDLYADYPAAQKSIIAAYRRGKRAAGRTMPKQSTKKSKTNK